MTYIIYLFPNYVMTALPYVESLHLVVTPVAPSTSKAPWNGHLKGRLPFCVWLGILLLLQWHWFCLPFNFLKAFQRILDWILILSLSIVCYFPTSQEKKNSSEILESSCQRHPGIWVSELCTYIRMECSQDSQVVSCNMRYTLADCVLLCLFYPTVRGSPTDHNQGQFQEVCGLEQENTEPTWCLLPWDSCCSLCLTSRLSYDWPHFEFGYVSLFDAKSRELNKWLIIKWDFKDCQLM